jgi:hypothetical protein
LPDWIKSLNESVQVIRSQPVQFKSEGEGTGLTSGSFDINLPAPLTGSALRTPLGAKLTVDAALAAVHALGLGKGKAPDVLAVSFSGHDFLAHDLGPNRRELEELTVAEDRELARLFAALAAELPGGLDDALIALTAAHGGPPSVQAARAAAHGDESFAGYLEGRAIAEKAEAALAGKWGPPPRTSWISGTVDLNFWLNQRSLAAKGIAPDQAERALRDAIRELVPEAAFVLTRGDIEAGRVPGGALHERALRGYLPGQSGDVVLLPKPFFGPSGDTVFHFADSSHELTVPLILSGRALKPGTYATQAMVVDLAPTLSFVLGTVAPALSEGRVLSEALR